MSTSIANITWSYAAGSTSTRVEYKKSTSSVWIVPSSPSNPTVGLTYPLSIENGVQYDVRLTTFGSKCGAKSRVFVIINAEDACCPIGWTLSDDRSYCYQVNTTVATAPTSPSTAAHSTNTAYGNYGTLIYDPGYAVNGTGTSTLINYSNIFWQNTGANLTDSPLNRNGLWATVTTTNQDIGFSVCLNVPATKTYYIGMGCDNWSKIRVDGATIVDQDPVAMAAYLNSHGYPGVGIDVTFKFWHIYPVMLNAGLRVIELVGHNDTGPAAMGAEIYDATSAEIQAATSYGALGSKLLFSTKDYFGHAIQLGSGGVGYSCPSGYSLVLCDGPAYCKQVLTTPLISC